MINKSNVIRIFLYSVTAFIACLFFPWWIIAIIGTGIGFFANTKSRAIIESIIALSLSWLFMIINNFFIDESKFLIVEKMQEFLGIGRFFLIVITLAIPVLVGSISSLFGYELRKVVKDDE